MLTAVRYETIKPDTFTVGDIAEVRLSFKAKPVKARRIRGQKPQAQFKFVIVLRSIALINEEFSLVKLSISMRSS
jgi:hypothetical protein